MFILLFISNYLLLLDCSELTKDKIFFIQYKQWSTCRNQMVSYLPMKFGVSQVRKQEGAARGGDQGTVAAVETW